MWNDSQLVYVLLQKPLFKRLKPEVGVSKHESKMKASARELGIASQCLEHCHQKLH